MATTIRSTDLDFETIKSALKTHLVNSGQFTDYNFEASGLSSLLDVLAYNTHYNGLIANFALNEAFLSTAQLRSSVVGLAGSIGYVAGSKVGSSVLVGLTMTGSPTAIEVTMPKGTSFSTTVNGKSYKFRTREVYRAAQSDGYVFKTESGSTNIPLFEGVSKTKVFYAGADVNQDIYVIPDDTLDLNDVTVRVYTGTQSTEYSLYTSINDAQIINADSKIYVLREAPNGYYELSFSDGVNLGLAPQPGNRIEITYNSTVGNIANGATTFTCDNTNIDGTGETVTVTTGGRISSGGLDKEGIEEIRKSAPFLYAAQNRMVTAEDYAALSKRNYSGFIENIKAWGGEDNVPPRYGAVYLSIDFFDNIDAETQTQTKNNITELARNLSVASFEVFFVDPVVTYLEIDTIFDFDQNQTSLTKTGVETAVSNRVATFLSGSLGTFSQAFRRSNLLTEVDTVESSVLSSRANIKMQARLNSGTSTYSNLFTSAQDYTIVYPSSIETPQDNSRSVISTNFTKDGKTVFFRNKLNSTVLELIDLEGNVVNDNIGSYNSNNGTVTLTGFVATSSPDSEIRVSVVPANQSSITPKRNAILEYDAASSTISAISIA